MGTRSYKDLQVWQKSIDLVELVYSTTSSFPKSEIYGLTNQIRRSVVSIPSNIAEGSQKRSSLDFIRYINIARGSVAEIETQLIIANRLKYLNDMELKKLVNNITEINKMLNGLRTSLETRYSKLETK